MTKTANGTMLLWKCKYLDKMSACVYFTLTMICWNKAECNVNCPENKSEKCGGYHGTVYHRISLYDTWLCITVPCQNGATCIDIDVDNYRCSCSVGWSGRVCNETETYTEIPSASKQAIGSSTEAETFTTTTTTIFSSSSTQPFEAAQQSENKLAIYIAVPVSIVVLIVFVLIVTVLILRANQNEDDLQTTYQNSANAAAGDNDHNYDVIDRTGDTDHNYYSIDQTGDGDRNYSNIDQTGGGDQDYSNINQKV